MFNFPSERMIPMSESLYDNDQKLKTSHVFKAKMKLDKLAFHRCIAEGLGWSITDFPVVRYAVKEVTQPYVETIQLDVFLILIRQVKYLRLDHLLKSQRKRFRKF